MPCTVYTCEDLWDRLVDTDYVVQVFEPMNAAILAFVLAAIYFGKFLYSLPFYLHDALHDAARKRGREQLRAKRSKKRHMRRASTRRLDLEASGKEDPVEAAAVAPTVADEDKPDAATAPSPISVRPLMAMPSAARAGAGDGGAALGEDEMVAFVSLTRQLVENDNPAIAFSFTGYIIAVCIVATGPRTPPLPTAEYFVEFVESVIWTSIGLVLLMISSVISDRVVLYRLLANDSLLRGNVVTGMVGAASNIAAALVIRACLSGDLPLPFWQSISSTLLYFVLGQVCLTLSSVVLQVITPYDDQFEAALGNVAAGVKFAGNQLALGILISSPLLKSESLLAFALSYGIGLVLLVLLRFLLSKVLLPLPSGRTVDDEISQDQNWGIALVEAGISVAVAICLDVLLAPLPCPVARPLV